MDQSWPTLWPDPIRNPTFTLARITWPAYLVPTIVAAVFLLTRPWHRLLARHDGQPRGRDAGNRLADWINNGQQRIYGAGDPQQQIDGLIVFFHMLCTGTALRGGGEPYKDELMVNCFLEASALLITALYSEPTNMIPHGVTAIAWMLLPLHQTLSAAPAALLALPYAWQLFGNTRIWEWNSGTLLFALAYNLDPRLQHPFLRAAEEYLSSRTLMLYLLCMLIGMSFRLANLAPHTGHYVMTDILQCLAEAARIIARLALLKYAESFNAIAGLWRSNIPPPLDVGLVHSSSLSTSQAKNRHFGVTPQRDNLLLRHIRIDLHSVHRILVATAIAEAERAFGHV